MLAAMALSLAVPCASAASEVGLAAGRRISFNDGWRFFKGEAPGAEAAAFDDSQWTEIALPTIGPSPSRSTAT